MSFIAKLFGGGTKGIGQLAKDIREAVKGKELDPNAQLEMAAKFQDLLKFKKSGKNFGFQASHYKK